MMFNNWSSPEEMYADCPGALHPSLAGAESFYVEGDDHLLVQVTNNVVGVALTCSGRQLLLDGSLKPFSFPLTVTSDSVARKSILPLAQGWILSAVVTTSAGTPTQSSTYVVIELVRGNLGQLEVATLQQGFVTTIQRVSFPLAGGGSSAANGLPTTARVIVGTQPGAGGELLETVPAGKTWQLISLRVALVTSVTAGNRQPRMQVDDGVNVFGYFDTSDTIAPSGTKNYLWAQDYLDRESSDGSNPLCKLPNGLRMPAGCRIRTVTGGIAAGDQYGAPIYLVQEG